MRQIDCVGRFEMPERLLIRRRPNFQLSHPIGNGDVEVPAPRFVYQLASTQAPSTKAKIRSELLKGAKTVKQLAGVLNTAPRGRPRRRVEPEQTGPSTARGRKIAGNKV